MTLSIKTLGFALALGLSLPVASHALASPETDALSACLIRSSTPQDKLVLTRWAFAAISKHEGVSDLASLSDAQMASVDKAGGALFSRLLIENCPTETTAAIRTDGVKAIETALSDLGQSAMQDLAGDPGVQGALVGMVGYMDQARLLKMLSDAASK
ncbi:hypothetical protein [Asticcacaulis taihuensis]|uniref:hypothetical protein n=1 Tax=Asticcacaulis taihuensis TaxID=260084 RepID=UPI0026EC1BF4|nr:hypothetical protein [Asticcacaulis taihuensis]